MAFYPNINFQSVVGHGVIRGQLMECEPPAIISGINFNLFIYFDTNTIFIFHI